MKLNKPQIKYIEDYLIKNEVVYWDVRIELLDHCVIAVEEKIAATKMSFIEALAEVHKNFGNQLMSPKYEGEYYLEKSLYQTNNGFKKLLREKQKQLGKKYNKQFVKQLKCTLKQSLFWLEYAVFIALFYVLFSAYPKHAIVIGMFVLMMPILYTSYWYLKDSSTRCSLSFAMATNTSMVVWSFYNVAFILTKNNYEGNEVEMPYLYFYIVLCMLFPIVKTMIKVYKKVYAENRSLYKKYV
jgi:hypothetical protein